MSNFIMNFTDADVASFTIAEFGVNGPSSPTAIDAAVGNTCLKLYGKNTPTYGEKIEENLIHIMENFAGPAYPQNAILGQLWYLNLTFYKDSDFNPPPASNTNLGWYFWNGTAWSIISSSLIDYGIGAVESQPGVVGHYYYRSTDGTFYQYVNFGGTTPRWRQLSYSTESGSPSSDTVKELRVCVDPTATAIEDRWERASTGALSTVALFAPLLPQDGDFWYDDTSPQLYIWDGSSWDGIIPDVSGLLRINGTNSMVAELAMGANKIVNQKDPDDPQDGATKNYVDITVSGGIGVLNTDVVANDSSVIGGVGSCSDALDYLDTTLTNIELHDLNDVDIAFGSPFTGPGSPMRPLLDGDFLQYNGAVWTNTQVLQGKKTIAAIADSQGLAPEPDGWTKWLGQIIEEKGAPYEVINAGRGGLTVDQSYNPANDNVGGQGPTYQTFTARTSVEQVIDIIKPEVVLYNVGAIDVVILDKDPNVVADEILASIILPINAALPDTKIILSGYLFHDAINWPVSGSPPSILPTLKYKGVFNYLTQSYGLMKGTTDPAELDLPVSSAILTKLNAYEVFKQRLRNFKGSNNVVEFIEVDAYKVGRMGLTEAAQLHPSWVGTKWYGMDAYDKIRMSFDIQVAIPDLDIGHTGAGWDENYLEYRFHTGPVPMFTSVADDWVYNGGTNAANTLSAYPSDLYINQALWAVDQKRIRITYDTVIDSSAGEGFFVELQHAFPDETIELKLWVESGSPFAGSPGFGSPPVVPIGEPTGSPDGFGYFNFAKYGAATTNGYGCFRGTVDITPLPSGDYKFKLRINNDEFGPFDVSLI